MFCKWCGMESVTKDQCSWCHRSFSATTSPSSAGNESDTEEVHSEDDASVLEHSLGESPLVAGLSAITARNPAGASDPASTPPSETVRSDSAEIEVAPRPVIGVRGRPAPPIAPGKASFIAPGVTSKTRPGPSPAAPRIGSVPAPANPIGRIPVASRKASPTPSLNGNNPTTTSPNAGAALNGAASADPSGIGAPVTTAKQSLENVAPLEAEAPEGVGLAQGVAAHQRGSASTVQNTPTMGTFPPVVSKYYPDQVIDAVSGTHYDTATGKPVAPSPPAASNSGNNIVLHWDVPEEPASKKLANYLLVFLGIILAANLTAYLVPGAYGAPLAIGTFLAGMFLPIMKAVPWQDVEGDDAWLMAALVLIFGPAIALVIYATITIIRQDYNPAVFGCLIVATILRFSVDLAVRHTFSLYVFQPPWIMPKGLDFDAGQLLLNWIPLLVIVGWFVANIFHKIDE